jgi:hypothetical protein
VRWAAPQGGQLQPVRCSYAAAPLAISALRKLPRPKLKTGRRFRQLPLQGIVNLLEAATTRCRRHDHSSEGAHFGTVKQALAALQCNHAGLLLSTAAGRHMQAGHKLALPRSRHAVVGI